MAKTQKHTQTPKKRKGWGRFSVYICLLVLGFMIGGFFTFALTVDKQVRPDPVPQADGIVVWTGKGGGRLEAGALLLTQGKGERLLISGVNEQNDRDDVLKLLNLTTHSKSQFVDLDYQARDTVGNARETSSWAEALGYEHIILVTSAYHMPRAEIEIAARHSRIHITPYPVMNNGEARWWNDGAQFRRMGQEYGKLLLTYFRRIGQNEPRSTPVLEGLPENGESESLPSQPPAE